MNELQRNVLLRNKPVLPPAPEDEEEIEYLADLGSRSLGSSHRRIVSNDLSPLKADDFFQEALEVDLAPDTFRVYYTPARPEQANDVEGPQNGTLVVCHHGASSTGLSFASFGQGLRRLTNGELGCLALDARGHGRTRAGADTAPVLTLTNLADDLVRVLRVLLPDRSKAPSLLLVGHSMGGPVVVEACARIQDTVAPVLGCVVLDAVEGSALEALQSMSLFMQTLPKGFESVEDAIAWHLTSRTIGDPTSARLSVPQIVVSASDGPYPISWRVDLAATEPYWQQWFVGLSAKFLGIKAAKLLVLAGTDRLDKPMMIGQMQGKFQLVVWPDVRHNLHEDAPERLASTIVEFWRRNDTADILKHVKKVGR